MSGEKGQRGANKQHAGNAAWNHVPRNLHEVKSEPVINLSRHRDPGAGVNPIKFPLYQWLEAKQVFIFF